MSHKWAQRACTAAEEEDLPPGKVAAAGRGRSQAASSWRTHSWVLDTSQNPKPVISTQFAKVTVRKTENKARSRQGKRINSAFIFGEREVVKVWEAMNLSMYVAK